MLGSKGMGQDGRSRAAAPCRIKSLEARVRLIELPQETGLARFRPVPALISDMESISNTLVTPFQVF